MIQLSNDARIQLILSNSHLTGKAYSHCAIPMGPKQSSDYSNSTPEPCPGCNESWALCTWSWRPCTLASERPSEESVLPSNRSVGSRDGAARRNRAAQAWPRANWWGWVTANGICSLLLCYFCTYLKFSFKRKNAWLSFFNLTREKRKFQVKFELFKWLELNQFPTSPNAQQM